MQNTQVTSQPGVTEKEYETGARLQPAQGILDRAFLTLIRWDVEKLAWGLLLVVALLARTIGLGDRAMSHDESLHTVYSWKLYRGDGYQHSPMMHGPLKFHLTALMYFLFGVNDWSSRLIIALFGVLMVGLLWLTRRWIGKTGAFLAAAMFAISPALLYHSRYIRDEVALCALLVLLAIGIFRYLETRSLKWMMWTGVALGLAFLTMEASFIYGGIFGIYLIIALAARLSSAEWPAPERRSQYRIGLLVAFPALFLGLLLLIFGQQIAGFVLLGIGALAAAGAVLMVALTWRSRLHAFAELDLIVLLGTLVMPFLSAFVLLAFGWDMTSFNQPGSVTQTMLLQGGTALAIMFAASALIGWFWLRNRWFAVAGVFWAIELLFFTTFLTNGQGVATGLVGSLGYWIPQQEVQRGGQPWYYFLLQVPLYEFLPLLLSAGGIVAYLTGAFRREESPEIHPESNGADELPAPADAGLAVARPREIRSQFVAFLVFWVLATWGVFSYVGEKMPWHVVYFATPMAILGGWWLGQIVDRVDWPAARRRGAYWFMLMIPIFLLTLRAVFPVASRRPFDNVSINGLTNTVQWLLALVVALVLVYLLAERVILLGRRLSLRLLAVTVAALAAVLTFGVAYRFAFVNYEYAIEPMVYAHGTPDIKLAMDQIEEISRKTVGDHALKVAYDDDATWPLEWYLRDYTNRAYYGATPNRDALDAPVVIAGDKNLTKVRPYLGDRYYEFNYRLIWWPKETYKNLSWQRIWDGIRDPATRGLVWDVILQRRYVTPTAQWDPIHRFSLFVRKDVAGQVWDWGVPPAEAVAGGASDEYAEAQRRVAAVQQLGTTGVPGSGPGQLQFPRAVAVATDGTIYVADSGNHRIQVFAPDGNFLREWGSMCKLFEGGEGCQGEGQGQFNEPWGIAVDGEGRVYVADTWNHRVQVFDSQGQFLSMWGAFESTQGELGKPSIFYGPRAVAVGRDGLVYVTDTGNKRVQAFRPDGAFVAQYGGGGLIEGRFDEPVGLAQDADGRWYVADTWNQRIQQFDESFVYLSEWPIDGWLSQNVANKPYLAVDGSRGLLYATDPENYRVLVFRLDGSLVATFGLYGNDAESFLLPTGLAVGPEGKLYVADGDAHRILVFPPVE